MLSTSEIILFLVIVAVTYFFHKWPGMADAIARMRLRFDKEIAEEYIEALSDDGGPSDEDTDTDEK